MSRFPRGRRFAAAFLIATALAPTAAAVANVDPLTLEDEVVCVVCKRPLSVSSGSAAEDERDVIKGLADQGLTKDQIKTRLVAEYGQEVLVDDKSPIAAAAPWITAVVGIAAITLLLRRRGARRDGPDPAAVTTGDGPDPAAAPAPSAEDEARIEAELAARD